MQRALVLAALTAAPIIAPHSHRLFGAIPTAAPVAPVAPAARVATAACPARGKTIVVETGDGLELAGTYYAPKKRGRAPAALLIHDAGAERGQMGAIAERLQDLGFGVLAVDLRGHGESRSDGCDWSKESKDQRSSLWQRSPRDVAAAAHWILSQQNIHSTNLSLLGDRAGCALAVKHALADANVRSMALLSPRFEEYGFDVEGTIMELDGLPTCVIDLKNKEGEKLVADINDRTSEPWINLISVPPNRDSVLGDKKARRQIASWMGNIALPKKGGRKRR